LFKRLLVSFSSLLMVFCLFVSPVFALGNQTFTADTGTGSNGGSGSKVYVVGTNGNSLYLAPEQSASCDGLTFTDGQNGTNVLAGNGIVITNEASFVKKYGDKGLSIINNLSNSNMYNSIHVFNEGDCSYNIAKSNLKEVSYVNEVYVLQGYTKDGQTVGASQAYCTNGSVKNPIESSTLGDLKGTSQGNVASDFLSTAESFDANMSAKNANTATYTIKDGQKPAYSKQYNDVTFMQYGESTTKTQSISANCAGLYEVGTTVKINGQYTFTEYSTHNVTPTMLVNINPPQPPVVGVAPLSGDQNPTPDVWISK
jgi:hypothetical protein